jgi:transcriptional regulator with XRE-family HTH domain
MGEKTEHKIAEAFGKALRKYREHRGLRQQDLIDLLARDHGVKMDRATLTRIESGDRRVTLEEAVLFAVALDVPLPLLLLPIDDETDVTLTPTVHVYPWLAWEWMRGHEPLPTSTCATGVPSCSRCGCTTTCARRRRPRRRRTTS